MFYKPLVREPSIWTTDHVEFSTTMTFEHLILALNDQLSLYDSINEGAFAVLGDLSLLTTTANTDIVSAVNELDSDLWGPGGGSVADLAIDGAISLGHVVAEMAQFLKIGDSDQYTSIDRDSNFQIIVSGPNNDLGLISDHDVTIDAGNNINLNTNNGLINIDQNNIPQLQIDLSDPSSNDISSLTGDLNLYSSNDIGLYPTNNLNLGGNPSSPNIEMSFGPTNVLDVHGNYDVNIDGDLDLKVAGNDFILRDSDDNIRWSLSIGDPLVTTMNFDHSAEIISQGDISIQGSSTIFYDELGTRFGAVVPVANHLQIQTQSSPAITFDASGASFSGEIRLPSSGPSAPPAQFQTDLGTSVTAIHDLIDALNNKIPLVYNRNGVILNKLVLS